MRKHVVAAWGDRPLTEIRRREVHALLDDLMDQGKPVLANRLLAAMKKSWNWWLQRDLTEFSPVQAIERPAEERARARVLHDSEIAALWLACDAVGWPMGAITRLLLLSGCRRTEIGGAKWAELDLDARLLIIPPQRHKAGLGHAVPLSDTAFDIVQGLPRLSDDWVFPAKGRITGAFSGWSKAKRRLDRLSGVSDWHLHDLRRSTSTRLKALGFRGEIVDRLLGHTQPGMRRHYDLHDYLAEKRAAVEAWDRALQAIVGPAKAPAPNVAPIREAVHV